MSFIYWPDCLVSGWLCWSVCCKWVGGSWQNTPHTLSSVQQGRDLLTARDVEQCVEDLPPELLVELPGINQHLLSMTALFFCTLILYGLQDFLFKFHCFPIHASWTGLGQFAFYIYNCKVVYKKAKKMFQPSLYEYKFK